MVRRITTISMAGLGIAFGLLMLFASASNAGYSSGSAGTPGGGNCSFSSAWNFSTSWPSAVSTTHGCNGTLMGDGMGNQCTNKGGVEGVWWLGDRNSPVGNWWIKWYSGGNDDEGVWKAYIDSHHGTIAQAGVNFAKSHNSGQKTLIWLCKDDVGPTECSDIDRPKPGGTNADFYGSRSGSTNLPSSLRTKSKESSAKDWCFLNCPTAKPNAANGNALRWVRSARSDKFVPNGLNDAGRGEYCANRPAVRTDKTATATRSTTTGVGNDDNGAGYEVVSPYPYAKTTTVNWGTEAVTGNGSTDWNYENNGGSVGAREADKTAFGELMDTYAPSSWGASDSGPSAAQLNAAKTATDNLNPTNVKLGDSNRDAIARGGVMTTLSGVRYYTANERRSKRFTCDYVETQTWSFRMTNTENLSMSTDKPTNNSSTVCPQSDLPDRITASNKDRNNYRNWSGHDTDVDIYAVAGTEEVVASWQALANHCNAEGYKAASPAAANGTTITQINNNDASKNWAGSSVTESIKASPLNNLVWGNLGLAASQKDTQWKGFFDKECAFNGVLKGEAQEASTKHKRDNKYELNKTTVDLFVPKSEAVVHYDGSDAVSTTVTRWAYGTPYPAGSPEAVKGEFNMATDAAGSPDNRFFDGAVTDESVMGQKNWSVDEFKTANSGLVADQANVFYVASNWASERAAPQVLTVKYEYEPMVDNTIPVILGFNASNDAEYSTEVLPVAVQGKIYAKPGATSAPAVDHSANLNMFEVQANTTGSMMDDSDEMVPNTMDSRDLPFSPSMTDTTWQGNPRAASPYYRVLQFIRTTTE